MFVQETKGEEPISTKTDLKSDNLTIESKTEAEKSGLAVKDSEKPPTKAVSVNHQSSLQWQKFCISFYIHVHNQSPFGPKKQKKILLIWKK